ncbi:MAG: hypothetical protein HRU20_27305 [Pseudomonadales bacterium]|nr:hypothetical protein [Pseudomonadales bacterium]
MIEFVRSPFSKLLLRCCCLLVLLIVTRAAADTDTVRWHGFASQGVIKTSDNNFLGDSEDYSWDFTDIGLGVSWRPVSKLQLSAQVVYRRAGETSPDDPYIDYGFINYSIVNELDWGIGARAGRIKNPFGFYNETRDVASTRPSVFLPQSIYPDTLRDLYHSSDSVSVYGYSEWDKWLMNVDLVRGQPNLNDQSASILIPGPQGGDIDNEQLWLARLLFEYDAGRIRIGFSFVDFSGDLYPEQLPTSPSMAFRNIYSGQTSAQMRLLSLEYNWEHWQFTTEYLRNTRRYSDVFGAGSRLSFDAESYYFQLRHQITLNWSVLGRYDVYYPNRDDKNGHSSQPSFDGYSKDLTLSTRYDFSPAWMVAAEIHQIKGTAWLTSLENPDPRDLVEDWNLYTLQVSFKF